MSKGDWKEAQKATVSGRQQLDYQGNPLGLFGGSQSPRELPNLANDLLALAARNRGSVLPPREGMLVSDQLVDVSNVMRIVPLPAGVNKITLRYQNISGNAGNIKIVFEGMDGNRALAAMSVPQLHVQIQPGETLTRTFLVESLPAFMFVKASAALSSGNNILHIDIDGELLPANANAYTSKLKYWAPCLQLSPDAYLKDALGNSDVAFPGALTAGNAWASPGGLSLAAQASGATGYPIIPAATLASWWNWLNEDSFFIHVVTDVTPGAGNLSLLGWGYSSTVTGVRLRVSSAGLVIAALHPAGGSTLYSTNPVSDVSVGAHSIGFALLSKTRTLLVFVDGVLDSSPTDISAAAGASLAAIPTGGLVIGGEPASTFTSFIGPAQKMSNLQWMTWRNSEPSAADLSMIASRLHSRRGPLLASELP